MIEELRVNYPERSYKNTENIKQTNKQKDISILR